MSATTDGNGTALTDAVIAVTPEGAPIVDADAGDVSSDALGIGFSEASLELAEADEDLVAIEEHTGNVPAASDDVAVLPDELPDEVDAPGGEPPEGEPPETALSADDGDVEGDGPPVGFDDEHLRMAEEDDELHGVEAGAGDAALQGAGDTGVEGAGGADVLPGEDAPAATVDAAHGLVTQPSKAPTRKVKAAGLGGVLGAIPAPILTLLDLVHLSDATVAAISSVLTVLGSLAAAYLTHENAT